MGRGDTKVTIGRWPRKVLCRRCRTLWRRPGAPSARCCVRQRWSKRPSLQEQRAEKRAQLSMEKPTALVNSHCIRNGFAPDHPWTLLCWPDLHVNLTLSSRCVLFSIFQGAVGGFALRVVVPITAVVAVLAALKAVNDRSHRVSVVAAAAILPYHRRRQELPSQSPTLAWYIAGSDSGRQCGAPTEPWQC
jgi:hypothetical protein